MGSVKLSISTSGSGEPLVLLHPFPLSGAFWTGLRVPDGFRQIVPDFPGFGAGPLSSPGFTLEQAALTLQENLEEIGINKPFILGGISMGGYWALEFFRQYPQKVSKLILISTRAGVDKPESRQKRLEMAERVQKEGTGFMVEAMVPGLLGKTTREQRPKVVQRVSDWIRSTTPAAVALAQSAMANRRDQMDLLSKIKVPTLILAGTEDGLIPVTDSESMSKAIQVNRLRVLERVGHLLPLEDPVNFEKILDEFLLNPE